MAPMVHGLEAMYFGRIDFHYLDADDPDTWEFKRRFGFYVQPEFYLVDGQGQVVKKWVGFVDEAGFRTELDRLLGQ
jgi:hypothetical protein